jgi:DNA-binding transcriptional regulator YiaG
MGDIMTAEAFIRPGEAQSSRALRYEACGLDEIYLLNGFKFESRGGRKFIQIMDCEALHMEIARHLVLTRKVLSGKEIRFIRVQMDQTQRELAESLGLTSQTVARWEKDQIPIPGAADRLLRILFMVSLLDGEELHKMVSGLSEQIENMDASRVRPALFNHDDHHWSEKLKEAA